MCGTLLVKLRSTSQTWLQPKNRKQIHSSSNELQFLKINKWKAKLQIDIVTFKQQQSCRSAENVFMSTWLDNSSGSKTANDFISMNLVVQTYQKLTYESEASPVKYLL
jgi:hypothetical protein